MKASVALLLIACAGSLISQSSPSATPAVIKWLQGLDARKEGFDRMRGKLKALANGPNGNTRGEAPRAISCSVTLGSALVVALTHGHIIKDGKLVLLKSSSVLLNETGLRCCTFASGIAVWSALVPGEPPRPPDLRPGLLLLPAPSESAFARR